MTFLVAGFVMAATLSAQCDGNLVVNGDQENGPLGGQADGFFSFGLGGSVPDFELVAYNGGQGIQATSDGGTAVYGRTVIPASEGVEYTFSVDVEIIGSGEGQIYMSFRDGSSQISNAFSGLTSTPGVTTLTVTAVAPANTDRIQVFYSHRAGTAIADNWCLTAPVMAFSCPDNLFPFNNDAEAATLFGWYSFSGTLSYATPGAGGSDQAIQADAGEVAAFEISDGFTVGNFITACFDVMGQDPNIHIEFKNDRGVPSIRRLGPQINSVGSFTNTCFTTTVPEGTTAIQIFIQSRGGTSFQTDNRCITDGGPDPTFVLPITLEVFGGEAMPKVNKLNWTTSQQENTAFFVLERSRDGFTGWAEVTTLAAAGNSDDQLRYEAEDKAPFTSSYYRLRSVDLDGSEQISDIVHLLRQDGSDLLVYPNPVGDAFTVDSDLATAATFRLLDGLGRTLRQGTIPAGVQRTRVEAAQLPAGRYLLRIGERTLQLVK